MRPARLYVGLEGARAVLPGLLRWGYARYCKVRAFHPNRLLFVIYGVLTHTMGWGFAPLAEGLTCILVLEIIPNSSITLLSFSLDFIMLIWTFLKMAFIKYEMKSIDILVRIIQFLSINAPTRKLHRF
jgi:hypothetical protein